MSDLLIVTDRQAVKRQTFFDLAESGELHGYRGGRPIDWPEYRAQARKARSQRCPHCERYGREVTFMIRRGGGRNPETQVKTLAHCVECGHVEIQR